MKRILFFLWLLGAAACTGIDKENPYLGRLQTLRVTVSYPAQFGDYLREGVVVQVEDVDRGNSYRAKTDPLGTAAIPLTDGRYRVSVSDRVEGNIFNGLADNVVLAGGDMALTLDLIHSLSGTLIFKEIYAGGCSKYPEQGTYQSDKYVVVHNNSTQVEYLDGLCFGALDPYNAQGTNVWVKQDPATGASIFPDFVPIVQCVWQFGGSGTSFPLAPGEDAVVALCGAIDHTAQYPLSVNLNKTGYFVCYNNIYFWNTTYHPAPGDRITSERYLRVVIKTGVANAYAFSVTSPAPVLFRAQGTTIDDFVSQPANVIQKPGSNVDRVVKIPLDWVVDGVEVFAGGSSSNAKRLPPNIDAGYVTQSGAFLGRSLHRKTDEQASAQAGYEVLVDTNNSSNDFYERTEASLRD